MKDGTKYRPKKTGQGLMPGDPSKEELVNAMIRVNHAGEHGAVRIVPTLNSVEGAKDAPGYELLTSAVKAGSRLAIWLSTRA